MNATIGKTGKRKKNEELAVAILLKVFSDVKKDASEKDDAASVAACNALGFSLFTLGSSEDTRAKIVDAIIEHAATVRALQLYLTQNSRAKSGEPDLVLDTIRDACEDRLTAVLDLLQEESGRVDRVQRELLRVVLVEFSDIFRFMF